MKYLLRLCLEEIKKDRKHNRKLGRTIRDSLFILLFFIGVKTGMGSLLQNEIDKNPNMNEVVLNVNHTRFGEEHGEKYFEKEDINYVKNYPGLRGICWEYYETE